MTNTLHPDLDGDHLQRAIAARVHRTTNQTGIANDTETAVIFDNETFDTDGFHDNTTNNTRLTVPAGLGGYYLIGANIRWGANATSWRALVIRKNGTANLLFTRIPTHSDGSASFLMSGETVALLAAGDYVECFVAQKSGGSMDLSVQAGAAPHFWITLLGV